MRIYTIILLLFLTFTSAVWAVEDIYLCPMHPHIEGKEGESCPICGMTLVPKVTEIPTEKSDTPSKMNAADTVFINPTYIQALGVKTDVVTSHEFGKTIKSFGRFVPNTRLEEIITVRENGWIIDLAASAIGDNIKQGDLLFTFYSPNLMSAQSDYLIGNRTQNAEQRLRLYGMDDKAIAEFKKGGTMMKETPFYSPKDGVITKLEARPGMYMKQGSAILTLQDLSKIWVNAEVPLRDVNFLAEGQKATIVQSETGENYKGTIDFIHPVANAMNRTVLVRIVLNNPNGELKPESYADVIFEGSSQTRLAVPQEAVLFGGQGKYVMEVVGDGQFKPTMVETGITSNGLTEITGGLEQGQNIVTSGQFMIDAESNLRGGMASMGMNMDMDANTDMGDMEMENMGEPANPTMKMEGGHAH